MMFRTVGLRLALATALAMTVGVPAARAAEDYGFEQPVDPQDTLKDLDEMALAKQKELMQAKMRGDQAAIQKSSKEFKEIQERRAPLAQKMRGYR